MCALLFDSRGTNVSQVVKITLVLSFLFHPDFLKIKQNTAGFINCCYDSKNLRFFITLHLPFVHTTFQASIKYVKILKHVFT
jgi:hypothetical protein